MKQRLKAHKSGARYLLRAENVAIASYFPISVKVHQVRCIISRDGVAERGEWITTQPFSHSTTETSSDQVSQLESRLESRLERLAELRPWASADAHDGDYAEPTRRSIRFWSSGSEIEAYLPCRSFWPKLDMTSLGVAAFNDAWSFIWHCAGSQADINLSNPDGEPD